MYEQLPGALLPWYRANARALPWRRDREPYHVWVSEIMLQQTRVEAVCGYYTRFLEALPTLRDLAACSEGKLLKLWEGLGYYSRARNLQKTARILLEDYGGQFPADVDRLRALPGVGPYTAGAIASICFNLPTPAVDGNVLRVAARIGNDSAPIDQPQTKKRIAAALEAVYPPDACGTFTQALMELGALICTPRSPKCADCPAASFCLGLQQGTVAALPVRSPKREKRVETRTVLLLWADGRLALTRREQPGLLSGLWELPNVTGRLDAAEALAEAARFGLHPVELEREVQRSHVFTHIRWEMTGYQIRCAQAGGPFIWASPDQLRTRYALPTAFRIFLDPDILHNA